MISNIRRNKFLRTHNKLFFVVPFLSVLILVLISLLFPNPNWDAIGYSSVVFEQRGESVIDAHSNAYRQLYEAVPAGAFKNLTTGNPYRKAAFQNPQFLHEMYGAYSAKILYVKLLLLLSYSNLNLYFLMTLISTISGALSFLILYRLGIKLGFTSLLSSVIPILGGLIVTTRLRTPDALSILFLCIFLSSTLNKKRFLPLISLSILPFIRPENLIIYFVLLLALSRVREFNFKQKITFAVNFVFVSMLCKTLLDFEGSWSMSKSLNFLINNQEGALATIAELNSTFSIYSYIYLLASLILTTGPILLLVALPLVPFKLKAKPTIYLSYFELINKLLAIYSIIRIILFPLFEIRFFTFQLILILFQIFYILLKPCEFKSPSPTPRDV